MVADLNKEYLSNISIFYKNNETKTMYMWLCDLDEVIRNSLLRADNKDVKKLELRRV